MANWGNEYTDGTKLDDLKLSEKEAIEAEKIEEDKADAEEKARAEAEAVEELAVDEKKEEAEDELIDLDELEKTESVITEPEKVEVVVEEPKKEIEKELAPEMEIKIGEETYDAKRAEVSIKRLNEIEKDEFLKNLIEHRNNGGDVMDYLKANNNNEDEMSSEELVRRRFDNDPTNKGLGREELDLLWEAEKESKYPTVVDKDRGIDERSVKIGIAKLNRDAAAERASIKSEKAKFKVAAPKTEVASELVQAELEKAKVKQATAQAESLKQWNDEVDGHETTKSIQDKGMVILNIEGKKIGYKTPNPSELIEMTKDLGKFIAKTVDKDGHVKLDVFTEIMAFAQNPEKFKGDLVKYGRSQEKKSGLKDAKVIDPSQKSTPVDVSNQNKEGMSATMASIKSSKWGSL